MDQCICDVVGPQWVQKEYVAACSGILKPIIAKWECILLITSRNKATSSFSYTMNMSKYSTPYVSDHMYRKNPFVLSYLVYVSL